jgi:hypothetical protein
VSSGFCLKCVSFFSAVPDERHSEVAQAFMTVGHTDHYSYVTVPWHRLKGIDRRSKNVLAQRILTTSVMQCILSLHTTRPRRLAVSVNTRPTG